MPQLFDYIYHFRLVDWNTIVIYTCQNPQCLPDYSTSSHYLEEFAYIQMSEDFGKVQYGDEKQIKQQE